MTVTRQFVRQMARNHKKASRSEAKRLAYLKAKDQLKIRKSLRRNPGRAWAAAFTELGW